MLAEFFDKLVSHFSGRARDRVRVIKYENSMPGITNAIVIDNDGTIKQEVFEIKLAPNQFVAKTIRSFRETIASMVTADEYEHADVFIGEEDITCFLCHENHESDTYHQRQVIKIDLEHTQGYEFASKGVRAKATVLKYQIMELFKGLDRQGVNPIIDLVPLLSKVSVNERKTSKLSTTGSNNSIGMDVQQDLVLSESDTIPELVSVPVKVYEQHEYVHYVSMLFRYDFDNNQFVLTPIKSDLDSALDAAIQQLTEDIDKIELDGDAEVRIFPSSIKLPTGKSELL